MRQVRGLYDKLDHTPIRLDVLADGFSGGNLPITKIGERLLQLAIRLPVEQTCLVVEQGGVVCLPARPMRPCPP